jgi:hypothetical protein
VPGWLEAIERAGANSDFIAGTVVVDASTPLERLFAISAFPRADELDDPSALIRVSHRLFGRGASPDRTGGGYMAFRREVWESLGGFPVGLPSSEDRAFSTAAVAAGFRVASAPEAVVHWRPRASLGASLRMFFRYCRGDVRVAPRTRHVVRASAYAGAGVAIARGGPIGRAAFICGGLAYLWLPVHRARQDRLPGRYLPAIPLVVALKDLAQIAGAGAGIVDALRASRRSRDP